PADAPHMDPALVHTDALATGPVPSGAGVRHVIHQLNARSFVASLPHVRAMSIADPVYSKTSELGYYRLRFALAKQQAPNALSTVPRPLSRRVAGGRGLSLGTGPSAQELDPASVTAAV